MKDFDKWLLLINNISDIKKQCFIDFEQFDIEKEKEDIKNYKYESYFIKQYCNEEELKIFQEAIDIAYISPRASFMMLRFFLETVFKRKIPIYYFFERSRLIKNLKNKIEDLQNINQIDKNDIFLLFLKTTKKMCVDNKSEIDIQKNLKVVCSINEFKTMFLMIDYRSIGDFLKLLKSDKFKDIQLNFLKNQNNYDPKEFLEALEINIKDVIQCFNFNAHKHFFKIQTPIKLMLFQCDFLIYYIEKFIENPKNLENLI